LMHSSTLRINKKTVSCEW